MKKTALFRGVRKGAYISRQITSKMANLSGRVENKADRIIHGTDPTVKIHEKILQEEIFAEALPEIIPIHPSLPTPGRKEAVNLLLPSLQPSSFFGGTATAIILSAKLAKEKSLPLRIIETLVHGKDKKEVKIARLISFLSSQGFEFEQNDIELIDVASRKYYHYGYIDISPEDIFIASAWWDAYILQRLPLGRKFIYLIQDYEPIFYNNSDKYALAEETYRQENFIPVCNTKLMYQFMKQKGYGYIAREAVYFEPALNMGEKMGHAKDKQKSEKKIMFIYGRPSVARNLFYRSLEVVNQAFLEDRLDTKQWEVYMAGQDKIPNILLECGVTIKNLGKMPLDKYYDFAKSVDVGISLMMAPHPSYPPIELSTLGVAVVTTAYETKTDLSNYSENILIVENNVNTLVDALVKAAAMSYDERIRNAKNSPIPSSWNEALANTIKDINRSL